LVAGREAKEEVKGHLRPFLTMRSVTALDARKETQDVRTQYNTILPISPHSYSVPAGVQLV
jgi:hypothetical protein